jgi:hypothetical protein
MANSFSVLVLQPNNVKERIEKKVRAVEVF